jgi:hypothetical protein
VKRRLAVVVAAWMIAACATSPPPPPAVEADEPEPLDRASPSQPMVEYPPIEPVEPPEALTPAPTPVIIAPPAPPSTAPPVAMPPAVTQPPAASPPAPAPAQPAVVAPEISAEEQQMNALLADLNRYGSLAADDVKREIGIATQALSRQRTDHNRIRLAMLYTLARTPLDDQRALQLFDNVLKGNGADGVSVKALAAVLQLQVAERVRAVRDEQRKGEVAVQKLEALREMERSLLRDRIRSGGGGAGGGGGGGSAGH